MWDGYFRRLISSAIDVDRYALFAAFAEVAGRRGAIASRLRAGYKDGQAGCGGCESAIIAQYGAQRGHLVTFQSLSWTFKRP